ncbi:MAG: 7TM-DISM domain-containing protein [Leptospiraceae bacterium]|nr:7TM-DISM domain-containing protein [Leptospiraceae bacterium]
MHALCKLASGVGILLLLTGCGVHGEPGDALELRPGEVPESSYDRAGLLDGALVTVHPVWAMYWKRFLDPEGFRSRAGPSRSSAGVSPADSSEGSANGPLQPDFIVAGMRPWTSLHGTDRTGYATYRTVLRLPANRIYVFTLSQQLTSSRIYINGELMAQDGTPGTTRESTVPSRSGMQFQWRSESEMAEIVIHVSNFHAFRGGLRGPFEIGFAESVEPVQRWRDFREIFASGFLLAIALYHFFLFWVQRKEFVYLFFALLCLSFALRIPFLGEKTIGSIWPALEWHLQYRFNMTLNMLSPPLMILYFRALFPSALHRKALYALLVVCGAFALTLFADTTLLGFYIYGYYLIVAGPVLVVSAYMVLARSVREKNSTRIMALGMAVVCLFGLFAIYENFKDNPDAADLALLAFLSFGLFQAVGVAQRHRESVENEKELIFHLERSKLALSHQRQSLENDLHDSLGSRLVDLKIQCSLGKTENLASQLDEVYNLFRGEVLFMEDLEYASRNPITGLQLSLLRRYSGAGRELNFQVEDSSALESRLQDDAFRMELFQLTREICTNDLKYGQGESRWRLSLNGKGHLELLQMNRLAGPKGKKEDDQPVSSADMIFPESVSDDSTKLELAVHARKRIQRMSGRMRVGIRGHVFYFRASIPFPGPKHSD